MEALALLSSLRAPVVSLLRSPYPCLLKLILFAGHSETAGPTCRVRWWFAIPPGLGVVALLFSTACFTGGLGRALPACRQVEV